MERVKALPDNSNADWFDVLTDFGEIKAVWVGSDWVAYYRCVCGCRKCSVFTDLNESLESARLQRVQKCWDCRNEK